MRRYLSLVILGHLACAGLAYGDDPASPAPAPAKAAGPAERRAGGNADGNGRPGNAEARLLTAVREAMERNAREIKSLKEQYAKDMAEQRKTVAAQQAQIETLRQGTLGLEERLKTAQTAIAAAPGGQAAPGGGQAAPGAGQVAPGGGQPPQGPDRQQRLSDIQQKQLKLIEEQMRIVADEVEKRGAGRRGTPGPDRHPRIPLARS